MARPIHSGRNRSRVDSRCSTAASVGPVRRLVHGVAHARTPAPTVANRVSMASIASGRAW